MNRRHLCTLCVLVVFGWTLPLLSRLAVDLIVDPRTADYLLTRLPALLFQPWDNLFLAGLLYAVPCSVAALLVNTRCWRRPPASHPQRVAASAALAVCVVTACICTIGTWIAVLRQGGGSGRVLLFAGSIWLLLLLPVSYSAGYLVTIWAEKGDH